MGRQSETIHKGEEEFPRVYSPDGKFSNQKCQFLDQKIYGPMKGSAHSILPYPPSLRSKIFALARDPESLHNATDDKILPCLQIEIPA